MREDTRENYFEEEDDVYSETEREKLLEDDEISPEEDAFMEGWEEA